MTIFVIMIIAAMVLPSLAFIGLMALELRRLNDFGCPPSPPPSPPKRSPRICSCCGYRGPIGPLAPPPMGGSAVIPPPRPNR